MSTVVDRAPDAGTIFRRKGRSGENDLWRLRAWFKLVPREWPKDPDLREFMQSMTPAPSAMVIAHCPQNEATHVSGSGVDGCFVPLSEIEIVGMVNWSEQELADVQQKAVTEGNARRLLG